MANKQSIYADRIVGFSIHNGLVRMDLAVFAGTGKNKEGEAVTRMDVTHQVVLPLDAFVAATNAQQNMLKQLADRQAKAAAKAAEAAPAKA